MPYVLDESSYRVDKTVFPDREEATDRASEASRILGRPVTVYELVAQELHFAFRVLPDGSVDETNPLPEHVSVEPTAPVVLGSAPRKRRRHGRRAVLDAVAEVLERNGRADLAAAIDREACAAPSLDDGIRTIVDELKRDSI